MPVSFRQYVVAAFICVLFLQVCKCDVEDTESMTTACSASIPGNLPVVKMCYNSHVSGTSFVSLDAFDAGNAMPPEGTAQCRCSLTFDQKGRSISTGSFGISKFLTDSTSVNNYYCGTKLTIDTGSQTHSVRCLGLDVLAARGIPTSFNGDRATFTLTRDSIAPPDGYKYEYCWGIFSTDLRTFSIDCDAFTSPNTTQQTAETTDSTGYPPHTEEVTPPTRSTLTTYTESTFSTSGSSLSSSSDSTFSSSTRSTFSSTSGSTFPSPTGSTFLLLIGSTYSSSSRSTFSSPFGSTFSSPSRSTFSTPSSSTFSSSTGLTFSSPFGLTFSSPSRSTFSSPPSSTFSSPSSSTFSSASSSTFSSPFSSTFSSPSSSTFSSPSRSSFSLFTGFTFSLPYSSTFSSSSGSTFSSPSTSTFTPSTESTFSPSTESTFSLSTESTFSPSTESTFSPSTDSTFSPSTESTFSPSTASTFFSSTRSTFSSSTGSTFSSHSTKRPASFILLTRSPQLTQPEGPIRPNRPPNARISDGDETESPTKESTPLLSTKVATRVSNASKISSVTSFPYGAAIGSLSSALTVLIFIAIVCLYRNRKAYQRNQYAARQQPGAEKCKLFPADLEKSRSFGCQENGGFDGKDLIVWDSNTKKCYHEHVTVSEKQKPLEADVQNKEISLNVETSVGPGRDRALMTQEDTANALMDILIRQTR